jgi:hypothetical protein
MSHRETSDELSSLAAEVLGDPDATPRERRLAASVLSQDETRGRRGASGRPAEPIPDEEPLELTELAPELPPGLPDNDH